MLFKYSFYLLIFFCATKVWSADICNPTVKLIKTESSIAQLLTSLAEKYNFELSFPKNLDKPIAVNEDMALDKLIKMLTSEMNTVLRHEKVEGCSSLRLVELSVIPTGDKSEFITIQQNVRKQPTAYIYIDDMEKYVTEVLLKQRKAKQGKMTPQQFAEFKLMRKKLKKELKSEIELSQKNKDKSHKKQEESVLQ